MEIEVYDVGRTLSKVERDQILTTYAENSNFNTQTLISLADQIALFDSLKSRSELENIMASKILSYSCSMPSLATKKGDKIHVTVNAVPIYPTPSNTEALMESEFDLGDITIIGIPLRLRMSQRWIRASDALSDGRFSPEIVSVDAPELTLSVVKKTKSGLAALEFINGALFALFADIYTRANLFRALTKVPPLEPPSEPSAIEVRLPTFENDLIRSLQQLTDASLMGTEDFVITSLIREGLHTLYMLGLFGHKSFRDVVDMLVARRQVMLKYAEDMRKMFIETAKKQLMRTLYIRKFGLDPHTEVDLAKLSDAHKKLLKIELEQYEQITADVDCTHKDALAQLREHPSKATLARVKEHISEKTSKKMTELTMYSCVKCDHRMICPHLLLYYTRVIEGEQPSNIVTELNKFANESTQSDVIGGDYYYCRICGEALGKNHGEKLSIRTRQLAYSSDYESPIQRKLWKECIIALRGHVTWTFPKTQGQLNQYASDMAEALYGLIEDASDKVKASHMESEVVQNAKFLVYLHAYVYAALVRVANINKKIMKVTGKKGNYENGLAAFLYYSAPQMTQLALTPAKMKNIFERAYSVVVEQTHATTIAEGDPVSDATTALMDPHYFMRYNYKRLDDIRSGKKPRPFGDLKYYMDNDPIFKSATGWQTSAKLDISKAKKLGQIIDEVWKVKEALRVQAYKKMFDKSANIGDLRSEETLLNKVLAILSQKVYLVPPVDINFHWRRRDDITWASIYGADGHQHVWDILVLKSGKGTIELTRGEYASRLLSDANGRLELADYKCKKCTQSLDQLNKIKQDIYAQIQELRDRETFANYFEFRCPAKSDDSDHVWSDSQCEACGAIKDHLTDEDYYRKYVDKLPERKIVALSVSEGDGHLRKVDAELDQIYEQVRSDLPKTIANRIANIVDRRDLTIEGVDQARMKVLLMAMARTEGILYDSVIAGEMGELNLDHIISHLLTVVIIYNNFRSHHMRPVAGGLSEYIAAQGKSYDELPPLPRFAKYLQQVPLSDRALFAEYLILQLLLDIPTEMAKYALAEIFRVDKTWCQPKPKDIAKEESAFDDADESEDLKETDVNEYEEGESSGFSYENIDYDGHNDEDHNIDMP